MGINIKAIKLVSCVISLLAMLLFSSMGEVAYAAKATTPNTEIILSVDYDGTAPFSDADANDDGTVSGAHTPGLDLSGNNNVVRTFDSIGYRIDWNVNEVDSENVVIALTLPNVSVGGIPIQLTWLSRPDQPLPSGCLTSAVTPVSALSADMRTLICNLGAQPEGSAGAIFAPAELAGGRLEGEIISLNATIDTDQSPAVTSNSVATTISSASAADWIKGYDQVSIAGSRRADEYLGVIRNGVEGRVYIWPIYLALGGATSRGSEPMDDSQTITFYDHLWDTPSSAVLLSDADVANAAVFPNYASIVGSRGGCGGYDGADNLPFGRSGLGTPAQTDTGANSGTQSFACAPDPTASTANGYPVVQIDVSGHDTGTIASQTTKGGGNSNVGITGQISFWMSEADLRAHGGGGTVGVGNLGNAISGSNNDVNIAPTDLILIQLAGTTGPFSELSLDNNFSQLSYAWSDSTVGGGDFSHMVMFSPGPYQEKFVALDDGTELAGFDYTRPDRGGRNHWFEVDQRQGWLGTDVVPRGRQVTIIAAAVTKSNAGSLAFDDPVHLCLGIDTRDMTLTNLPAVFDRRQVGSTSPNDATTVTQSVSAGSPSDGPYAHLLAGDNAGGDATGFFSGGVNTHNVHTEDAPTYKIEFGFNPQYVADIAAGKVNEFGVRCNNDDSNIPWVEASTVTDPSLYNAVRVVQTQRKLWGAVPLTYTQSDGDSETYGGNNTGRGYYLALQAEVRTDFVQQAVGDEIFVNASRARGDWDTNVDNAPANLACTDESFFGQTVSLYGTPTAIPATPPDGWCNLPYDQAEDAAGYDFTAILEDAFGPPGRGFADADKLTITGPRTQISKSNVDGLNDIVDNGDEVTFRLDFSVVGSATSDTVTNIVVTDFLPSTLEFVSMTTPTTTTQEQAPVPTGATDPLPTPACNYNAGSNRVVCGFGRQAGGWSDSIDITVRVNGAEAGTVISNITDIRARDANNTASLPTVQSLAYAYMVSPKLELSIRKEVPDLEGNCVNEPGVPGGTGGLVAGDCSMIQTNGQMQFELTYTNDGNKTLNNVQIIDVLPHLADQLEAQAGFEGTPDSSGNATDQGDGRTPESAFAGSISLVSVVDSNGGTVEYSTEGAAGENRDPALNTGVWGAFNAAARAFRVTVPTLAIGEVGTITVTINTSGNAKDNIYTNTFGSRTDDIRLATRSNDVSIMVTSFVAVGNRVWIDDGTTNGTFDSGEGESGVVVELYSATQTPGVDTPIATTTTGADGLYEFDRLQEGGYVVYIPSSEFGAGEPLERYVSLGAEGGDDPVDNDDNGANTLVNGGVVSSTILLTSGLEPTADDQTGYTGALADNAVNMTVDFGFVRPVSIGSYVWEDLNADGDQDAAEPPLANATVTLFRETTPGSGTFVQITTDLDGAIIGTAGALITSATGLYEFNNLAPGNYRVRVTPPSGFAATPIQDAGDNSDTTAADELDSNIASEPVAGTFESGTFTVTSLGEPNESDTAAGDNQDGTQGDDTDLSGNMTVDFGFVARMSMGSYVWQDSDGDGVQESGEPAIPGATVALLVETTPGTFAQATDITGAIVTNVVTPASGLYEFDNLLPGNYRVRVTPPAGFVESPVQDAGNNSDTTPADQLDSNIASEPVAGTYESGTFTLSSGDEPNESDAAVGDSQDGIQGSVGDLNGNNTIDFGFIAPVSIGSFVFNDANGNGTQDSGEAGIENATLALFRETTPGSGTFVQVITDLDGVTIGVAGVLTTPASGQYQFDNLPPGNYQVQVTPPAGLEPTPTQVTTTDDNAEGDSNIASEPSAGVYRSPTMTLTSGGEPNEAGTFDGDTQDGTAGSNVDLSGNMTVDFGFVQPVSLGSTVWQDSNENGIQDDGEPPIQGVVITLLNADGSVYDSDPATAGDQIITATTDAEGQYNFNGLAPGDYRVQVDVTNVTNGQDYVPSPVQVAEPDAPILGQDSNADSNIDTAFDSIPADSIYQSGVITLAARTEPLTEQDPIDLVISNGLVSDQPNQTGLDDASGNMTLDFGFVSLAAIDFGDAPDSYETVVTSNAAQHNIVPDLGLGVFVDSEPNGFPSVGADGDDLDGTDDEDSIDISAQTTLAVADASGTQTVTYDLTGISVNNDTGADAYLVGYIDFNGDGDFDDPGERSATVTLGTDGTASLMFSGIADIVAGNSYVRLRLSSDQAAVESPGGAAPDGEIEDHPISILPVVRSLKVLVPASNPNTFDLNISSAPVITATGGDTAATSYVPFTSGAISPFILSETNVTDSIAQDSTFVSQAVCRDENGDTVLTGNAERIADGASSVTGAGASISTENFTLQGNSKAQNTITCTWTNLALATVSFIKQTNPAGSTQSFNFSVDVEDGAGNFENYGSPAMNNFSLTGAAPNNQISNMVDISDTVTGGLILVREGIADGWLISGVSCIADDAGGALPLVVLAPVPRNGASFPSPEVVDQRITGLENGDTLSCTYENVQLTSLGSTLWVESPTSVPNGVQDAGEAVIAGATVRLLNPDGSPATDALGNAATTTSSPTGEYFFNDLLPGDYLVQVDLDSTNTATGVSDITNLLPTATQVATPNNNVNLDSNIDLSSAENNAADQVWTSGVVTLLGGSEPSDEATPSGAVDSDQPGQDIGGANERQDNTGNMTVDFGFFDPHSIGSLVFQDDNNNGLQDSGENGIANARVQLFASDGITEINVGPDGVLGTNDDATGGVTTDGSGSYNFSGLPAGEYVVRFTRPTGLAPSGTQEPDADTDTNLDSNLIVVAANDATFNTGVITLGLDGDEPLTAGEQDPGGAAETDPSGSSDNRGNLTVDAGFVPLLNLGDLVWEDLNGDSLYSTGVDAPIDGATVSLLREDPNNLGTYIVALDAFGNPVAQITTDPDGLYNFTNLAPGNYRVEVTPPVDYNPVALQVADPDGPSGIADTDNDSNIDLLGTPVSETYVSGDITLSGGDEPVDENGAGNDGNSGNLTVDFGFVRPVSLGSTVWQDSNGNGTQDDGEPPIQGAVITVLNADGSVYDSDPLSAGVQALADTTDAEGQYNFNGLAPGDYRVQVDVTNVTNGLDYVPSPVQVAEPDNPILGQDDNTDSNIDAAFDPIPADSIFQSGVITLAPGTEPLNEQDPIDLVNANGEVSDQPNQAGLDDANGNMTLDFGFIAPANLGSFVWEDLNGDGIQDPNEPPISGAQVVLLVESAPGVFTPAVDLDTNPVTSVTTGPDGLYAFRRLPPGNYKVQVTPPSVYVPSGVQNGADNDNTEADSNINLTPPVALPAGTYESGLFTLAVTGQPNESGDTFRGDNQDGPLGGVFDLSGNMTIDFGFVSPAAIGNYVWLDLDMDGVQDANEDGISGVEVTLTPPPGIDVGNGPGNPIITITGPNGEYLFPDLPPFTNPDSNLGYVVTVDPNSLPGGTLVPPSLVQTYDEGLTGTIGVLDNSTNPIQLDPNEEHLTADFGYAPPDGSLGDTIWVDADDDGIQDLGEPRIAGVTVTLTPPPDVDVGGGIGVPITTVTDNNGRYLFTGLPLNESYLVDVDITTLPPGYTSSSSGLGDPDVRDGNSTDADDSTFVVLTNDTPVNLDADFGYLPPADQNNSVGDTIWVDADADGEGPTGAAGGSDASERPVPGVTVSLIDDATGVIIASDITDENGQYLFTGLPDGMYSIVVTDQNNVLSGLEPTFDNDGLGTPNVSMVDLDSAGVSGTPVDDRDQDFGYVAPNTSGELGVIGDTIFFDENDSGFPDVGEGLEGVTVKLFGPGPDGDIDTEADNVLLAIDVTNENGNYLFTGLSVVDVGLNPGTDYLVMVDTNTLPNGGDGWTNTVDPSVIVVGDSMNTTTLTGADPEDLDQDFGYLGTDGNSLSGTVWVDTDGNGQQEEVSSFSGVTIEVRDQNGNVIRKVTTDVNGNYSVTNLPDGTYTVVVTDEDNVLAPYEHTDSPNGTSDTTDRTSKDDTGYTVDLDSSGVSADPVSDETGDFGYQPVITNPISLGSFLAVLVGDGEVRVDWATQTEVANLGFNLFGQVEGEWVQLNESLIISQGDSVSIQRYSVRVNTDATVFAISDIDLAGKSTLHGSYLLGQTFGEMGERRVIDWQAEKAEREAKKAKREALRKLKQEQRMLQRQLNRQSSVEQFIGAKHV